MLAAWIFFLGLDMLVPVPANIQYAPVVKARDGAAIYSFLTRDQQWRMFTRLEEITPQLSKAILYKEDRWFYWHFGINPLAILRAATHNLLQGRRTSGASTITMQVARLLEPKSRSYGNKLWEMFRALQLEWHYSKKEILQIYLNLVPYGSNIQGVKAASMLYFNKSPDQLSLAELTALSIIPNRPNSLVPGKDNDRITQARNHWLQRFGQAGLFDAETIQDALAEPLQASRLSPPRRAPQLAWRMRRMFPQLLEIPTTIDARIQQRAEELTAQYSRSLKLRQIHNAAVIVLDNPTRQVLAYVGSPDFFDQVHQGQVDGVKAVRSPGSTLKPFLYGLAFDRGLVTPKSIINDVPVNYRDYAPENYDLDYRGAVSIEEALKQSLNVPAVRILNELGVPVMVNQMHAAGFNSVWNHRRKMGLSLILGGCGVRLEELAALYASFADAGRYRPLRWIRSDAGQAPSSDSSLQLLSPEAAYMLGTMLRNLERPDLPAGNLSAVNIPRIAWKTGTSYGRRDAWSIGYNQRYTIGVWIGNFSGVGAPELNGAGTATPLLFQLFNSIDPRPDPETTPPPAGLQSRMVCAMSGLPAEQFCRQLVPDFYIPGVSDATRCHHLKEVAVSADHRYSYCTSCQPAAGFILERYPDIAPELAQYYEQRHIPFVQMPVHNPDCSRTFQGQVPHVNSLKDGATYLITDKGKQSLQLSCTAAGDATRIYWYINDKFLGQCAKTDKIVFIPVDRKIKISCTDDKGRNANIHITVKFI
ncbi:penicillin-binding protein 1C [Niabella terrae]